MDYDKLTTKEKMELVGAKITQLKWKEKHFREEYGRTRNNADYQESIKAYNGMKYAKEEFAKLEKIYRKEQGIVLL